MNQHQRAIVDLLDVLECIHPSPGRWRTPEDDEEKRIEEIIKECEKLVRAYR